MQSIKRSAFPNDDDGEVLFSLASKGVDLTRKHEIEFTCYAHSLQVAQELADDLRSYGYKPSIFEDNGPEGSGDISVYLGIVMLLDHSLLLVEQERLNILLKLHNTRCDGWIVESTRKNHLEAS